MSSYLNTSSPEARADRIKYVRERLLNVSRPEFCKDAPLNPSTLKGWELSLFGGLTEKGADKISEHLKSFNVHCSAAWLLHGIGNHPYFVSSSASPSSDEEEQIANELLEFRKQDNTLDDIIVDDGMLPNFYPGDYVAGIICEPEICLDKPCIIRTNKNEQYIRTLKAGENGLYDLVCINQTTAITKPEIKNITVLEAAPIIWMRRKKPIDQST